MLVVLAALAVVPAASAAFPAPYAAQGGNGVLSNDHSMRFVAIGAGESTVVRAAKASGGEVMMSQTIDGSFGVPMMTQNGPGGGMFRDGSDVRPAEHRAGADHAVRVAQHAGSLDARPDHPEGTFGFDALSPDGSMLYLIQHSSTQDIQHYVVRAYDLNAHKLLPGRIADKTQKSWVMQGWAVSRVTSASGRWVYTLYANPGGYPFIHALDTVKGVAHCVGLPWPATDGDQNQVFNFSLALGLRARRWR